MDSKNYESRLKDLEDRYEGICKRCGECCGAKDDPCIHLKPDGGGGYCCDTYETRFGPQKTLSGKSFNCVTLRENIKNGWHNPRCAYFKTPKTAQK